ncbi:50S ribosomal protein L11 methyltransferase [Paucihalobacter ruber]|uniref:Ribosomal protein L11 methyltransferase n=1 Tax=Paucihalobacter ruber TaxID=2567861 RepID=A0A506PJV5_9FLAO|nr:50S ribosomal protein L11 methyltransferase [Paucihalobacter ruber]TPV34083.1 50S ribosomal protein L11 methyltransferase [Paucihalobacter ruber]
MNIYIAYHFVVNPLQPATDILTAELGYAGFESFVENEDGVSAYIQKQDWHEHILEDVEILTSENYSINYTIEEIEQQNWNREWETNFHPIVVDDKCTVRAPFHEKPDTQFDLIIEPKMSFGTGHHETTHMMIQHLLKNDLKGKVVLDMGCGTAVLAILAEKLGAKKVDAIDIDNWCYLNSLENTERNNCTKISVFEGDASLLGEQFYDVIIANINRNILLDDMATYVSCLNPNGMVFLSGFYREDIPAITEKTEELGLSLVDTLEKNKWVALKLKN